MTPAIERPDASVVERRRCERRAVRPGEPLSLLRLRTGREFLVIDIASRGALVEGAALLPGSHVDAHVSAPAGRVLVRCLVARCFVTRITAESVVYRGALAFEQPIDVAVEYRVPTGSAALNRQMGSAYPAAEPADTPSMGDRLTA